MTISYIGRAASSFGFGNFWKLLFRWHGSVYKLVWPELIIYSILYATMSIVYRLALGDEQRIVFEKVALECDYFSQLIPVSFVLGFYVTLVVARWWDQYNNLPWPDNLCMLLSTSIEGHDRQSVMMRRTIARYANLSCTMTFIMISSQAKKRFPTTEHLIDAGLLEKNELVIFRKMDNKSEHPKYWMPLVWASTIVKRARREGRIKDDFAMRTMMDEINKIRSQCGSLLGYDWINVPLVYTQVVTLAVYTFFLATIMGRQFLQDDKEYALGYHGVDYYVPIFTILQLFFYMGWLKVAETLLNPFGEDDDDFETNFLIDRNLQVSYLIVDEMHEEHPKLIQDKFWDEGVPRDLPYTKAAEDFVIDIPQGSTAGVIIPTVKKEILPTTPEGPEGEHALNRTKSFRSIVNQVKNPRASVKHGPRKPIEEGDDPVEMWSGYLNRDKKVGGKSKISVDTAKKAEVAKVATPPPAPKPAAPTPAPEAPKEIADVSASAAVAGKGGGDIPPIDDVPIVEEKPEPAEPVKKPLVKEPSEEDLSDWEREEEDLRDESAW